MEGEIIVMLLIVPPYIHPEIGNSESLLTQSVFPMHSTECGLMIKGLFVTLREGEAAAGSMCAKRHLVKNVSRATRGPE